MAIIGLNPSTADAERDDPTLTRCINFAMSWGYGGLVMLNLFAWSATKPHYLRYATDPIGPENDAAIARACSEAKRIVVAWGAQPWSAADERAREVVMALQWRKLYAIALTKKGAPRHPLYLKASLKPQLWIDPREGAQ